MNQEVEKFNRDAWDQQVQQGNQWTVPVSSEDIARAVTGDCRIVLTPTKQVPAEWLGELQGKDVLCLAGGGGQQAPLLAAAGANVSVLDNSPQQLAQDQLVAQREGLTIRSVLGSMADLSEFADESFDLIVHPCSNTFVPDILPVWREAYRVLKKGGELISGFCDPVLFVFDDKALEKGDFVVKYKIPYSDAESLDEVEKQQRLAEGEPLHFGHSLDDQIGGQIAAGFSIIGFFEDKWDADPLSQYVATYHATRSRK